MKTNSEKPTREKLESRRDEILAFLEANPHSNDYSRLCTELANNTFFLSEKRNGIKRKQKVSYHISVPRV